MSWARLLRTSSPRIVKARTRTPFSTTWPSDAFDVSLSHSFVAADDSVAQFEILSFRWTYLGEFRYRHDMREEKFGTKSMSEALGSRYNALSPLRTIQGNEDTSISNGALFGGTGRHE